MGDDVVEGVGGAGGGVEDVDGKAGRGFGDVDLGGAGRGRDGRQHYVGRAAEACAEGNVGHGAAGCRAGAGIYIHRTGRVVARYRHGSATADRAGTDARRRALRGEVSDGERTGD